MRRLAPLLIAAALLAGCGMERQPASDQLTVRAPSGTAPHVLRSAGMRFDTPANWDFGTAKRPRAFTLGSGRATITGWAYRRKEPLPLTGPELADARKRLLERIAYRNNTFKPSGSRTTRIAGHPAVVVEGVQTIYGQSLRTRSAHVFADRTEYVIDALGPAESFPTVEGEVLEPLLRSLKVSGAKA
ncbi:MAG: hypothetical protein H0T15_10190 [Thermoleophilaceae bacterium]|nr:hypothetical protein [Thermoleophilaceae bacterium]